MNPQFGLLWVLVHLWSLLIHARGGGAVEVTQFDIPGCSLSPDPEYPITTSSSYSCDVQSEVVSYTASVTVTYGGAGDGVEGALAFGVNNIEIVVEPDNTTEPNITLSVAITRRLCSFTVTAGVFTYACSVGSGYGEATLESFAPTTGDRTTAVVAGSPVALVKGVFTPVVITSTSEDNSTNTTYTVNVYRESDVATLDSISLGPCVFSAWNAETYAYNCTVDAGVDSVVLDAYSLTLPGLSNRSGAILTPTSILLTAGYWGDDAIIAVTADDGVTEQNYTINVYRKSSDTSLASFHMSPSCLSLVLEDGNYTCVVGPSIDLVTLGNYTLDVPGYTGSSGVALSSEAGSGFVSIPTKGAASAATITVTADDGATTQNYTVNVYRQSDDASLLMISMPPCSFTYQWWAGRFFYECVITPVGDDVRLSSVTFTTVPRYGDATFYDGTGSQVAYNTGVPISAGTAVNLTIVGTADDGTSLNYTVQVRRQSDDASLASISMPPCSFDSWNSSTLNYDCTVEMTTEAISLDSVTFSVSSPYTTVAFYDGAGSAVALGSNVSLVSGTTVSLTIVATADDGVTTLNYTIAVTRSSDVATLDDLVLTNCDPFEWSPSTVEYSCVTTSTVTSVAISSITPTHSGTSYVLSGNTGLVKGSDNQVTVTVTAHDGFTTQTYTITVHPLSDISTLQSIVLQFTEATRRRLLRRL